MPLQALPRIDALAARLRALMEDMQELRDEICSEVQGQEGQPDPVVAAVALSLGSTPTEVTGGRRFAGAIRARHAAALALHRCGLSYSALARVLGMQDHSTAINAVARGHEREQSEPAFAAAVADGVRTWRGGAPGFETEIASLGSVLSELPARGADA